MFLARRRAPHTWQGLGSGYARRDDHCERGCEASEPWVYATGDGESCLEVCDLEAQTSAALRQGTDLCTDLRLEAEQ